MPPKKLSFGRFHRDSNGTCVVALSKYSKSQIVQSDQIHNCCHLIMTPSPQSVSMLGSAYHGRGHVGDRAPMWEGRIGAWAVAKDGGRKFQWEGGELPQVRD